MIKLTKSMKLYAVILVVATLAVIQAGAIPKKDGEKHGQDRVYDKELSENQHYEDEEHNPDFDHEAFLGKDDAKTFDQLTPEESKERLGKIYDKIDKDKDGFVEEEELKNWIQYVQKRYIIEDTDRQWKEHEPEGDTIHWQAYKKRTYGFMDDEEKDKDDEDDTYADMIKRDERRWDKADSDGDKKLTKEEFVDFLHPEESDRMRGVVVDETLEDIDKDKDGLISLEEYIGDMYDPDDDDDDDEEEPEWLNEEKKQFTENLDKSGDGKLDSDEILSWIVPEDFDHAIKEAKHLLEDADSDKDNKLTKEEVLDKYDLFVGSQATDFGEALTRHDEF